VRRLLSKSLNTFLIAFALIGACAPAWAEASGKADTQASPASSPAPWQQTWMGASVAAASWSVYTGTTYAPFGSIHKDGVRLRMVAGYGRYNYRSTIWLGKHQMHERFAGQHGFGELLVGYQWQWGDLTVKGFVGGAGVGHVISPFDPENATTGTRYGVAAALETWLNLTKSTWISANVSWSSVFETSKADMRLGYRFSEKIDAGLEVAGSHDAHYAFGRLGGFAQYKWGEAELRLSGGWSLDEDGKSGPYGTLNLLFTY
jgi:hypothetical protein